MCVCKGGYRSGGRMLQGRFFFFYKVISECVLSSRWVNMCSFNNNNNCSSSSSSSR